jgi:psiF repeat
MAPTVKKAVKAPAAARSAASLACSASADKQNIHGKPRKKFMSDCKKSGAPTN